MPNVANGTLTKTRQSRRQKLPDSEYKPTGDRPHAHHAQDDDAPPRTQDDDDAPPHPRSERKKLRKMVVTSEGDEGEVSLKHYGVRT